MLRNLTLAVVAVVFTFACGVLLVIAGAFKGDMSLILIGSGIVLASIAMIGSYTKGSWSRYD